MRDVLRRLHYSIHTERAYCDWVERFVRFHHMQAREALFMEAERKAEGFLSHLAIQGKVAPSTQNQTLNALLFPMRNVNGVGNMFFRVDRCLWTRVATA